MVDITIDSPYIVRLEGAQALPHEQRVRAEMRYAAAFEKALGGAEQVVAAVKAREAEEAADAPPDNGAVSASVWTQACAVAQLACARDIGENLDVCFEIRLT